MQFLTRDREMPHQRVVLSKIGYRRLNASMIAVICVTLLGGCGGDPNIGDVSGKITLNGAPLEGAFVTFSPTRTEGVGSTTYGKTDSDGAYRMVVSETKDGAYIGENLVRVKTGDFKADGSGVIEEVVPAIYNSESKLLVEVKSGNNTFDFELESTGSSKIDNEIDADR